MIDQGYGRFTEKQQSIMRAHIAGARVLYPGSGWGHKAEVLIGLGADHVTCIEKEQTCFSKNPIYRHKKVEAVRDYVEELEIEAFEGKDVLLLSWVQPYRFPATAEIFERFDKIPKIVYLGKNTDGTQCGSPALYSYLLTREVLHYVPARENTMIIYGAAKVLREPYPEEVAGLGSNSGPIRDFTTIETQEAF